MWTCRVVICDSGLVANQLRRRAGFETLTPRDDRSGCESGKVGRMFVPDLSFQQGCEPWKKR
jgi:hypothetical protein